MDLRNRPLDFPERTVEGADIYWLVCPCLVAELTGGDGDPVLAARVPRLLLQHNGLHTPTHHSNLKEKSVVHFQIFEKKHIKKYKKPLKTTENSMRPKKIWRNKSVFGSERIRFDLALLDSDPDAKQFLGQKLTLFARVVDPYSFFSVSGSGSRV
jgi:hypothetical protein